MKFMHATIHFTAETDGAPRCGVGVQEAATFLKKNNNNNSIYIHHHP